MHQHIVDVPLFHVRELLLQAFAIRRASRGAGVDELFNDLSAELLSLPLTSGALRRDRVPLGLAVLACLARG